MSFRNFSFFAFFVSVFMFYAGCSPEYSGQENPGAHFWLKGKKIFLDPGHGGTAADDKFRNGPFGVTEEAVNLNTALILRSMLEQAGAQICMSRTSDTNISLDERADMAFEYGPDLLISIHHNGTIRAMDNVNYSCVLVHGTEDCFPAGYRLARCVSSELADLTGGPALVLSDYAVFKETGTRILRRTASLCPGIIGEGGFFSHPEQALLFKSQDYLKQEAEAWFRGISAFFRAGVPSACLYFSCGRENGIIHDSSPEIWLKTDSGTAEAEVRETDLYITLDDIPVKVSKEGNNLFRLDYGKKLYPGGHRFRFSAGNSAGGRSMVFFTSFISPVSGGDFAWLVKEGRKLLSSGNALEGTRMLMSASSLEQTGPEAASILSDISLGFKKLGLDDTALYFRLAAERFYADREKDGITVNGWYPVKYHGKLLSGIFGQKP